ncbi:MAG TPA: GNAT family N-acetyltransferase [Polyangia bacterium]|nr:GNAT family N-acetyltransferase [Polyangia bacterium]
MTVTDSASDPVQVRVVASDETFASLREAWERLQADAAVTSVFETFDWQYLWWRTYGHDRALKLFVAESGGALVGVLPLYVETVSILAPVRLLRPIGIGGDTSPDDLGPVLAKGREAEVARALADAVLALEGWDALLLGDMLPDNALLAAMRERAEAAGLPLRQGRAEQIAYIGLPACYDAWLQSLHRDRRYRIRNIRKKLSAEQPARFFVWSDRATLDRGIDTLVRLHRKRWAESGQSRSFASTKYIDFHRAVMTACFETDRLRLYGLELGGSIIAMFYFYKFRDRVYLMQSGFDPDYGRLKPGQVLLGHIVEHAIGEGHKVLDFLRGDHRYKNELANGERHTAFLEVFRRTPGAYLYRTRRIYLPAAKARYLQLRQRLRPSKSAAPPTETAE